ncbi:hypothetical protein NKH77_28640 [Streptomyces sp. M19]
MVQVQPGVDQPWSAGREARARVAGMLGDPEVAARLLTGGARVLVVPKDEAMTSLDAFRHLRDKPISESDRRLWNTVRGGGEQQTAITEENLLGETTSVPGATSYVEGYSTTTHEVAHAIHLYGLTDADRATITAAYNAKRYPPGIRRRPRWSGRTVSAPL